MSSLYNHQAPKKATNLSINSDLLKKAKERNINLSATLEQTLTQILREYQQEQWRIENQEAIIAYNQEIEQNGSFGDSLRTF
ncbi:MAG: type II toxin-antitoxin system CcdA family antitoxin [Acinetobacter populi]|jgi:antitoxin CcdA|uniref:type II toxin-antitoxin system CcdA family antitoxin n=1 Tax=Acinetobacter populi TaxID=1582270 RepID=UPI002356D249|nr:type II toxin-antitoxin system CcdA family antitoxin [Acinetobacter populi]MCH4247317.1 type II toxin-antitoxin system CcdA family antitoxin [Acinetobacter populi]